MQITDKIETGIRYYWKRSGGWQWFDGKEHWWEYFVEPTGLNGVGGLWVNVWHRWNSSIGWQWSPQPESWSLEKSQEVLRQIEANEFRTAY